MIYQHFDLFNFRQRLDQYQREFNCPPGSIGHMLLQTAVTAHEPLADCDADAADQTDIPSQLQQAMDELHLRLGVVHLSSQPEIRHIMELPAKSDGPNQMG